jgi:hypothetical protein
MTYSFDKYTVYLYSGTSYDALIQLFNGNSFVANITFYPGNAAIPANSITANNSLLINYRSNRFDEVLRLLQYEGPLQITVNPANGIGSISTKSEPVGEQEGV